ncbi:NB-ARC domain-containing protein [Streptomyces sp. NPDC056367]|uniref:ATP-binding protein n=1 Tax=Streptomyces sp. NPDC056367 TaxID=3345797 RepID=UPI0035E1F174
MRGDRRESGVFVGRGRELAVLRTALAASRAVTVVGPGGVGKSRTARHLLEQADPGRAVVWAELSQLPDASGLADAVAAACGLADHTAREPTEALSAWLAQRSLLLVLDSCEHLIPEVRALAAGLLTASPGLSVLATSREPLGLPGERVVELPPLGPDEALELFLSRAAAAASWLPRSWPPSLLPVARDICRTLQGIPLTLELAAAQLTRHAPQELAARLRRHIDPLASETPREPRRHQSLRTAIGWSHELCESAERLLWARLSVFAGPFDESDARAVCSDEALPAARVPAVLDALVAKSVVQRAGVEHIVLDTVREYGGMWLDRLGQHDVIRRRHAAHFHHLARQADQGWLSSAQDSWYQRLRARHRDLCAALDFFLRTQPSQALDMAARVAFFWGCCGRLHEAQAYLQRALNSPRPDDTDIARPRWALGVVLLLRGEHGHAHRIALACQATATARGDGDGDGHDERDRRLDAAYLLGISHLMAGRPLAARIVTDNALDGLPGTPFDSAATLRCHLARTFALTATGLREEARAAAEELREGCAALGEHWTRSYADYQLSLISLIEDRPASAARHARSMLGAKHRLGDSFGTALGLDLLAAAHAADGDPVRAARTSGACQTLWQAVGHPQRGTPELAPLRAECERSARARLGDEAYEAAYREGMRGGWA